MKPYLRSALAMLLFMSSCSVESESIRIGRLPLCDHSNTGRLILMAQSVPTAQLIPCIEKALPDGWKLEHADVQSGRSRLQFDNVAGTDVVVYLLPFCIPTGDLTGTKSGVETYLSLNATGRVQELVFDGGCIRLEVPNGEDAARMADAISSLTRDVLRAGSGWKL